MRDGEGFERQQFLRWAKDEYHAQEHQQKLQREDRKNEKDVKACKKSRWNRELQRRLGTHQFWLMVSFTGKFDIDVLRQVDKQPTDQPKPTPELTNKAKRARDQLRNAQRLQRHKANGRTNFKKHEWALLEDLASGKLLDAANDATRASGHGRIKNRDGSIQDITPHGGGIVRKALDHVDTSSNEDEFLDARDPDESEEPDWE